MRISISLIGIVFSLYVLAQSDIKLQDPSKKGFILSNPKIPLEEIIDGGVPKDGIPALFYPKFITPNKAKYLSDTDQVLGFVKGDVAKAYPIRILNFHEVVNDKVGQEQIVISFCPLCGSGVAFSRQTKNTISEFGVSGLLYNSDALLYDKATESLWSQLMGQAVAGKRSGEKLHQIPLEHSTWGEWKKRYPQTLVMSNKTGHDRDYGNEVYTSYLKSDQLMFPVDNSNLILPNKERVIGISEGDQFKAYPFSRLNKTEGQLTDELNGTTYTIHYNKETNQAWLEPSDWEKGVKATVLFWFAWYAFHPNTKVYSSRPK